MMNYLLSIVGERVLGRRTQKYLLSSWGAAWLLLLAQSLPSFAQAPYAPSPAANTYTEAALPEENAPYALGAGDRLAIDIFNIPEYSKEYQVLVDGTLSLPLAGKVSVKGLTLSQTAALITRIYSERGLLTAPIIAVNLVAPRPIGVNLIGAVRNPGSYVIEFKGGQVAGSIQFPKVTDALQKANGITAAADARQIRVLRSQGKGQQQEFVVNLWEFLQNGDRRQDLSLRDGDTISVPTATAINLKEVRQRAQANFSANLNLPITVSLVGEVNRPGPYTLSGSGARSDNLSDQLSISQSNVLSEQEKLAGLPTVTRAVQVAGGLTARADVRKVEVRRSLPSGEVQIVPVNLWDLLEGGDLNKDVVLQEGDAIVVPPAEQIADSETRKIAIASFSPNRINVNVTGEVKSPGAKALPPNVSLQQAILAAGGFNNERAQEAAVVLLRLNPNGTVERRQIQVDFARGLSEKDNPVLLNNDVVFVERSDFAVSSDFIFAFLNPFQQVFNFANLVKALFEVTFTSVGN
jgi:polysaccharide export outer membrane protein